MFLLALATIFTLTATAAPHAPVAIGAVVQGHVETPDHNHAADAQVTLVDSFSKKSLSAATDSEGVFNFSNVPAGAYDLSVAHQGASAFSRRIVVPAGRYEGLTLSIGLGSFKEANGDGTGDARSGNGAAISPERFSVRPMRPEAVEARRKTSVGAASSAARPSADAAQQTAGTNSAASFQIYSYVQNRNPPHVGFNFSDGHGESENEWLTNGGAEPWETRTSLTASQDGSSTTFVAAPTNGNGGTDDSASITSGFFNGATSYTYRYANGAWSLLRTDTVQNYAAVTGSANPADYTITYANSGPATQKGDIIWVEWNNQLGQIPGNDYYNRGPNPSNPSQNPQFPTLCLDWQVVSGGQNGCWQLYHNNPAPYTIVADAPSPSSDQIAAGGGYTDLTSLQVVDSNSETQGIQDYIGYNYCNQDSSGNYYESYTPGHTYQLGVWLKGNSTDGVVTLNYTGFNITTQFTGLSNAWQYYTYQFSAPPCLPDGGPVVAFSLKFNAPGTLEVNGLHVYDTSYPPFQIVPQVLSAYQNYEPGVIRFWSNQSNSAGNYTFWSLDSWLTPEWQNRSTPLLGNYYAADEISEHLPDGLALAAAVGTTPWFIVNMSLSADEWSNLYDFLAAPAGVGYASRRPANHPGPYTSDFSKIYLEVGNEQWGTIATAANVEYGAWVNYVTSAAVAGKNYANGGNVKFIANAFTLQPSFGSNAIKAAPLVAVADIANYTPAGNGQLPSAGASYYQSELLAVPQSNKAQIDGVVAQQQIDALAGFNYQLNIYEEGPGSDNPNISYGDPSLAAATAALDASLYATSQGVQDQGFFLYGLGTGAYSSHNYFAQGFIPHPVWEAFQARNQYLNGDSVLTQATANPLSADGSNSPLIGAYAFHDANDQVDVAVVSRDFFNTTPVTLNFPAAPTGTATLYSLTPPSGGDPSANNDTGLNVPVNSQTLGGVTQSYTFNMPPGSIYIFQVPTSGGWSSAVPLPAAPAVLQANADNNKVSLTWTPSATATGYTLSRSTQSGGPYSPLATVTGTSFIDTGVSNGTTYYYVVAASNGAGSSGNSQEVSAAPNVVQFGYTATPPPLDGSSGGAWNAAPEVVIGSYFDINSNIATDQAQFKALWDNNNLYLLATVEDPSPTVSSGVFNGDAVEVYFSAADSKAQTYGATDFQFGFPYGGSTVTESKHGATSGVVFGQQNTGNGYRMAIAIPWSTLGTTPSAGRQYGFDIQIDDAQTPNVLFSKFAWWATQNLSYQYPYLFGPAVLSSGSTLPAGSPIAIPNYSFEADTVPSTGRDYNTPSSWTFNQTNTAGYAGISQIESSTNGGFILGQDGNNYWAPSDSNNSSAPYGTSTDTLTSQPLGTYQANSVYNLTVALADPADGTPSNRKQIGFQLLADGNPVATLLSNNVSQGAAFQDKTLSFNTAGNASVVGKSIAVQLVYTFNGAYNRSAYFDNVRLTTTASGNQTGGSQTQIDLPSSGANAIGFTNDNASFPGGGIDGDGNAYSAQQTGSSLNFGNVTYNFGQPGQNDVITGGNNVSVALPSGQYSTLSLLGLAVNGTQTGTFTVRYATGPGDSYSPSLSDWFAQNPPETVAATYQYRDNNQGAQSGGPLHLYQYTFQLDNTRTLSSLLLPNNPNIVIVAATLLP